MVGDRRWPLWPSSGDVDRRLVRPPAGCACRRPAPAGRRTHLGSGRAGVLINTTRQLGGAVGLAVMATVAAGASSPTAGYDRAFWISAAETVTLAALAGAPPAKPKPQQQVTSGEASAEAAMLVEA